MIHQIKALTFQFFKNLLRTCDYDVTFFLLCKTFIFFKKKFSMFANIIQYYQGVYFSFFGNIYLIKISKLLRNFKNMRLSSIFWLIFVYLYHSLYDLTKFNTKLIVKFYWSFIIYNIFKNNIMFGFKSVKVIIGFWPKYLYTPSFLFSQIILNTRTYKNFYIKKKKLKKASTNDFKFKHLKNRLFIRLKKNSKFYNNVIPKITGVVHYQVSNLIKLFIFSKTQTILFIRKQKFFNKGRYWRNRQLYRTGVYWCIYINIIAVLGLNFLFYKFTINFTYYWWFFFSSICAFIIPYFYKTSIYSYICHVKNFYYYIPVNYKCRIFAMRSYLNLLREVCEHFLFNFYNNFID